MMWIKTDKGAINLAHAFEISYDPTKTTLTVWWAMPLGEERYGLAELYDAVRLCRYSVNPSGWGNFCARNFPS